MDQTSIGGYQLGKCLGTGATATVHVGTRQDGVQFALKILHPDLVDNPDLVERFRREARTLRGLNHANIVGFIDFIEEPPHYVFVMELLQGGTLETYLKAKGTVREDRCLLWTRQLAVALAVAHAQGVIHRDIKPANVFLTNEGRVVLSDFGLARPENDKVTKAGAKMMGTPLYMAPEQILGRTATATADVYQVGLLLYEMLVGDRPFPREDAYSRMMARLDEDLFVPMDIEIPLHFREIIRRCGFRDPEQRYPDGTVLALDLEAARKGERLPWTPPRPGRKRLGTLTTQGLNWKDPQHYKGTMLVCPQVNLRFDPQGKPFIIGSESSVQVCLESREEPIAPKQMRILPVPGGWKVENGNFQAEVKISGVPLRAGSCPLTNGDVISIGGYELLWVDHDSPPPTPASPEPPPSTAGSASPKERAPTLPQGFSSAQASSGLPIPLPKGCAPVLLLLSAPVWGFLLVLLHLLQAPPG